MAGSPSAPRRFPCVPAHPAPVLTHRNSRARGPALSSQPCSGSSICRCHPCAAAPERRGQGTHRETPSTGAALQHAKHKPKNQARPRNGRSSPWIFWKAESAAAPQLPKQCWQLEDLWLSITPIPAAQLRVLPSAHAPEHLVDEGESEPRVLPILVSVLAFFSPQHQEQESFVALLGHRDNEAPQCQGFSALLALPGYSEEFCRLQDSTKSGR